MSGTWTTTSETWTHYVWDIVSICADVDDDVPDIVNHVADMDFFDQCMEYSVLSEGGTLSRDCRKERKKAQV